MSARASPQNSREGAGRSARPSRCRGVGLVKSLRIRQSSWLTILPPDIVAVHSGYQRLAMSRAVFWRRSPNRYELGSPLWPTRRSIRHPPVHQAVNSAAGAPPLWRAATRPLCMFRSRQRMPCRRNGNAVQRTLLEPRHCRPARNTSYTAQRCADRFCNNIDASIAAGANHSLALQPGINPLAERNRAARISSRLLLGMNSSA